MTNPTTSRKADHIRINLEEDVSCKQVTTGFERYRFVHQALPNLDLEAVHTETTFLGKPLSFPLLIASMTGGSSMAVTLNRTLAEVAQHAGIGIGVGSMRVALENPDAARTFQIRKYAPDILLLANLGAVQLNYGYGPEECRRIVELIDADGLLLHLNPLQEALQPEGDTRFRGLMRQIEAVCSTLEVPVLVKEIGNGLSKEVARQLIDAGVTALDVAGAGGTSWSQVEMYRSKTAIQRAVAASFRDWGIPTVTSLQMVRAVSADIPLIASGGLHDGIEIAKALALGADVTAIARPLLQAAAISPETLHQQLQILQQQLRITMFAAGAQDIAALKQLPLVTVP